MYYSTEANRADIDLEMNPMYGGQGVDTIPFPDYNTSNVHYDYNAHGPYIPQVAGVPLSLPEVKPKSDGEDEEGEFGPQYALLQPIERYLWAQRISKDYTELQVRLAYYSDFQPDIPPCDNCRYRRNEGRRPLLYTCTQCIRFQERHLCKRCALRELSDPKAFHKPNHDLRLWQPKWGWKFEGGWRAPLPTPAMEDFVDSELDDELREATFCSSRYYNDRSIRIFMPAPNGMCRVSIKFKVEPIESVRRDVDIVDRLKGLMSFDDHEVIGNIGAIAYPGTLQIPQVPRRPLSGPPDKAKKGDLKLSDNLDIKRGDDCSKPRSLEVYVDTGNRGAIELVLQDEYYRSEKYRTRRIYWKLQSVSVTKVMKPVSALASKAQAERFRQEERAARDQATRKWQEEWQERLQRSFAPPPPPNDPVKYYQAVQERQFDIYKQFKERQMYYEQNARERRPDDTASTYSGDEEREARKRERQESSQANNDNQRSASVPATGHLDPIYGTLLSTGAGILAGRMTANAAIKGATQISAAQNGAQAQAAKGVAAGVMPEAMPGAVPPTAQAYPQPQHNPQAPVPPHLQPGQGQNQQRGPMPPHNFNNEFNRGRTNDRLDPSSAYGHGGAAKSYGRSTSPNWRTNSGGQNSRAYSPANSGSSGSSMRIPASSRSPARGPSRAGRSSRSPRR